jgi:TadE-like protein
MEAAITLPLFLLLIFGILEFGLVMRSYLSVASSTRDTARLATVKGADIATDYDIIQNVKRTLRGIPQGDILQVIVFKGSTVQSTTASGTLNSCRTSSQSNLCNTYTTSDLNRPATDFGCGGSSPDRHWCPTVRKTAVAGPPDFIGIYIKVRHKGPTMYANITKTVDDEVVMRIEPDKLT